MWQTHRHTGQKQDIASPGVLVVDLLHSPFFHSNVNHSWFHHGLLQGSGRSPADWEKLINEWLLESFDPSELLTRRPPTEAVDKANEELWKQCQQASLNLHIQFKISTDNGSFVDSPHYAQTLMLIYVLPCMVLLVNKRANKGSKNKIVKKRCEQFLQGKWLQLWKDTLQDAEAGNSNAR